MYFSCSLPFPSRSYDVFFQHCVCVCVCVYTSFALFESIFFPFCALHILSLVLVIFRLFFFFWSRTFAPSAIYLSFNFVRFTNAHFFPFASSLFFFSSSVCLLTTVIVNLYLTLCVRVCAKCDCVRSFCSSFHFTRCLCFAMHLIPFFYSVAHICMHIV